MSTSGPEAAEGGAFADRDGYQNQRGPVGGTLHLLKAALHMAQDSRLSGLPLHRRSVRRHTSGRDLHRTRAWRRRRLRLADYRHFRP